MFDDMSAFTHQNTVILRKCSTDSGGEGWFLEFKMDVNSRDFSFSGFMFYDGLAADEIEITTKNEDH